MSLSACLYSPSYLPPFTVCVCDSDEGRERAHLQRPKDRMTGGDPLPTMPDGSGQEILPQSKVIGETSDAQVEKRQKGML
ncbi:MAG: hypothetical protein WDW36_000164 [Sanguina aurantia]